MEYSELLKELGKRYCTINSDQIDINKDWHQIIKIDNAFIFDKIMKMFEFKERSYDSFYDLEKDGKSVKTVEKYKRYAHPDLGAIHLLLKNLDDSWRNDDKTAVDIKKQQLEIQREKAENAAW